MDFCWSDSLVAFPGQYMGFSACLEMQAEAAASALPQHRCSAACTGHTEGAQRHTHSQGKPRLSHSNTSGWTVPFPGMFYLPINSAMTSLGWLPRHGGSTLMGQKGLHEFD